MTDEQLMEFILEIEEKELIQAPRRMKQEILSKSKATQRQVAAKQHRSKEATKKLQFRLYSLKISVAVAAAVCGIFLINSRDLTPETVLYPEPKQQESSVKVGHYLNRKIDEIGDIAGQVYTGLQNFVGVNDIN